MKIAVRYYTRGGNTKKLAQAVAKAVGAEALPISVPVTERADILFLGNSYYAFSIDPEVKRFIAALNPGKVGKIVNFGSAALLNSTYKRSRQKPIGWVFPWMRESFIAAGSSRAFIKAARTKKI